MSYFDIEKYCDDPTCWCHEEDGVNATILQSSNSAGKQGGASGEVKVMSYGQTFETGNSTVAGLPVGSTFQKVGSRTLQVTSVPKLTVNDIHPGDRINTKYGEATVVGLSSRFGSLSGFNPAEQELYIADGSDKVRRINAADVTFVD